MIGLGSNHCSSIFLEFIDLYVYIIYSSQSHTRIKYYMKLFQNKGVFIYGGGHCFFLTLICLHNSFHLTGFNGAYLRKIADSMLLALPVVLFCKRKCVIFPYL